MRAVETTSMVRRGSAVQYQRASGKRPRISRVFVVNADAGVSWRTHFEHQLVAPPSPRTRSEAWGLSAGGRGDRCGRARTPRLPTQRSGPTLLPLTSPFARFARGPGLLRGDERTPSSALPLPVCVSFLRLLARAFRLLPHVVWQLGALGRLCSSSGGQSSAVSS